MLTLELVKRVVFEAQKVPHVTIRRNNMTTCTVFDKEGLGVFVIQEDREFVLKWRRTYDEVTAEDLALFEEHLGVEAFEALLS